uniref:3-isopropylmalate dehydratase small subunit n=1 Tax=Buchnera aphidicola subsp. Tetraneura caerulescens TaxID=118111 RepID=Q6UA42_BUCTC|nr:3-isopropylmalate dehydratase small subunit [Buchnera aphidicola (Tetraneura caerulescens)]
MFYIMNKKFISHTGIVLPLDIDNVDTDAIIPKQFLQQTTKDGFGKYLFHDWRFLDSKRKNKNFGFILNKIEYFNSSILLSRKNFGCGSSREHAVWAILDYGFRVIISSSFADIFYSNSINNNLLLVVLSEDVIDSLFKLVKNNIGIKCTVDLLNQIVSIDNRKYKFSISKFNKEILLNGLDAIDLTMKKESSIFSYENKIPSFFR